MLKLHSDAATGCKLALFSQRQDGLVVVVHVAAKGFAVEQEHQVASVDGVQKVELHSNDAHSVVLQGQSKKSRQQHQGSSTAIRKGAHGCKVQKKSHSSQNEAGTAL